ncbi:MAG: alpha/beta fold hydrolase [Sphingobium sp.]
MSGTPVSLATAPQTDGAAFGSPIVRRGYVDGPYGQVHYRTAEALEDKGLPTLVLLHQNPSSSLEYVNLIAQMGRDRRVIALDTPGYGMSDRPPAPLGMAGYAAALATALEGLVDPSHGPVDLYGFHTGTLLSIEFALQYPDRVRRLVLSGIPMHSAQDRAARLSDALDMPRTEETGEVSLKLAKALWDYVVGARNPGMTLEDAAEMWVEKLKPLDKSAWAYVGVWSYVYEERLPLLAHPVLVLQPDEDIAQQSLDAAKQISSATVERMIGIDRDIFHDPESLATLVAAMRRYLDNPIPAGV